MVAGGIGLALILGVFVAGLVLAEKGLVRRIRRIRAASHEVAGGDLTQRVPPEATRPFGIDELDELTTDFNHMIDQVAASYTVLRNANAMKTNFIRIAGHELRTPVSYILAMARLLRDSDDLDRFRSGVATMAVKAHRLEAIIQAIFKLLPEQGGQAFRPEPVRVSEVLESVYADCHPFVERRHQTLVVECAALPEIQADRGKLRDAVEQLTMNAVKFTPDGGTVRIRAGEQLGGFIAIAVEDQGAGIAPENLANIFEPFHSGTDTLRHSTGKEEFKKQGIGLGLTVAKHFAELHGGTVQVTTGPGGSTFTIIVPIRSTLSREVSARGAGI
jgi:signal transduction histidine kinase